MPALLYEVKDRVAYITLNRPEKLNAINREMREALFRAFADVRDNPDVWVAIVTGNGRAFSVGHDLAELSGGGEDRGPTTDELYVYQMYTWKPVIAAVNGFCLAQGAGIALCCDLRIASERASFGWPQVKRGISSVSGPSLLAHRIPLNRAFQFLFTGEPVDAQEALRLDLVNQVVPQERLMAEAEALARKLLENAPLAVRAIKELTIRGLEMRLEDRVRFAALMLSRIQQTEDAKEGLGAFLEKRQPAWKGR
ncbi:MAG: enoyl-CoA hydratase/isomerase family protein [Chloroflexi bacterium]|nr:enoyl-CoA hydratase/isomerase family protein [Chloroflexota bacterium]